MPLRIKCKKCGAVIYANNVLTWFAESMKSIGDILKERLNMKCPKCGRAFTDEDIANFQIKITGQPADLKFYQLNALAITAQKHRAKKRKNPENSYPYLKSADDTDFALDHLVG